VDVLEGEVTYKSEEKTYFHVVVAAAEAAAVAAAVAVAVVKWRQITRHVSGSRGETV